MHGFRWAWCSVLALALPASLALPTKAQAQTSHSQKTFVSRAAQQEASSGGAGAGVPWTGSPGITQTVEEIMARQRLLDAQPQAKLPPHPTKDFEEESYPSLKPNPESPVVSQWPALDSSIRILQTPFNPQTVATSFLGMNIGNTVGFIPPDSVGAVGPTQILMAANGRIRVFSKTGVLGGLDVTTDTFFASVRSAGTSDPHIRYDRLSQRWFVSMIDVGEETGQLPDMLLKIADVYDDEVDNSVAAMTAALEPIMIVFLALVVGTIVIALFLPLISIIQGLQEQT